MRVAFTILGEPASKANSRRLVKFGDRPAMIKSAKANAWEKSALLQIPASAKLMLSGNVRVNIRIFYASERPDLDESVVLDVLQTKFNRGGKEFGVQRKGVIINDRQVREKHIYWGWDRRNPRAEIEVEQMEAGLFNNNEGTDPCAAKTSRESFKEGRVPQS
jgi:Holliday junction resolvase RusA-like endonuclease